MPKDELKPREERSPRRRERSHRSSRRRRSSSRSPSRSRSRRHSRKRRSRSPEEKKRKEVKEETKELKEKPKDDDETETENDEPKQELKEKEKKPERASSSRKRRSRSGSPRSPSRSSRRRRHRRSYSRSRSASRSRRSRRSRSRSRERRRDRERRRRRRSYSRSRSRSRSRSSRRHRRERSKSRDRPKREVNSSPEPHQHPPEAAAAPTTGVNPTITQLMAQYPTMSLQDIIAKMQASNVTMAAAVAQKPARELYVGNLPPNVTGPQLQEFLGTIIQQVGLTTQAGNPIMNTWISTDGHFAFCEMRSVEECNLALLLNQLSLLGQPLKFGRPRSFMGPPQPMPQISARTQTALANLGCTPNPAWFAQSAVPGMSATSELPADSTALAALGASVGAGAQSNNLIMTNIPVVLTEDQVKELVQPFGALKSFTLVKDTATGASMGSAIFEYEDESVTNSAMEGLNGLDIGGILLAVQRQPHSGAVAPVGVPAEEQTSSVLKMANMVSVDELRDDEEYADLAEDVEEECKRFGTVASMQIPRPKDGEDVPGLGCIYVRFEKEADAISALKALSGRKFGGNIVKVTYFPVDKFDKREFS